MLTILTWLTLIVIASVVLLLAGFLIPTAISLIRANRNLTKVVGGLETIRDNTAPLAQHITAVNETAGAVRNRFIQLDSHLQRTAGLVRE